ncbi:hypothetical protein PS683_04891 [Pseudomonas fluorescens]|uniref:SH3b domain-containing protein n=1 Tax=Pseudomonas fluorescens TaxID=294 RepID=A0A5E6WQ40_PSEFL|nr:hypothetical protein PS683_04891 [Pseudomonas fluorescens]VVN31198.1 hypothetical protein PS683_04891 [Pseudomonas fluorescens]
MSGEQLPPVDAKAGSGVTATEASSVVAANEDTRPLAKAASQAKNHLSETSGLKAMAQIAKSFESNPALKAAALISKQLGDSPALKAAAQMANAFGNSPALKAMEQVAMTWEASPAMKAVAQIVSSWDANPAMKAVGQMLKSWEDSPSMKAAAQVVQSLNETAGQRAAAEFISPRMLKLLEEIQGSPLLSYLSSGDAPDLSELITAEGAAAVAVKVTGDIRVAKADSEMEGEILSVLTKGGDANTLPKPALAYLREYYLLLFHIMELFVLFIAIPQALEYLNGKLVGADQPEAVRQAISDLPESQRELLSSYRVLTRDRVILRSAPDKQSDDLGRLTLGTPVEVLDASGAWIKVEVELFGEAREGWVYRGFTAAIPPRKRY